MKKLIIDTKIKLTDEGFEDLLDKKQTVIDINETSNVIETVIASSGIYNFQNPSGKGMKALRIVSDVPITMSYTSESDTYNFGAKFKEIQLVANGEENTVNTDWIAQHGIITLTNTSTEDVAHIKIIFTY